MLQLKKFVFNPFQVNTYVLFDDSGECVIVDPGCNIPSEEEEFAGFIEMNGLRPVRLLNTHCHIDHIVGNAFMIRKYGLSLEAHPDGIHFIRHSKENAAIFGFENLEPVMPLHDLREGQVVSFGKSVLDVVETPGHAAGSLSFISHEARFVLTGDVLFKQSIGRTDLPTGNFDVLISSIERKLFTLPKDYTVYPGHGPETTIGMEMYSNPFLADLGA